MSFKLGILLPQSKQYPAIGRDFADGLQLAMGGLSVEWHIEGIGVGADMAQIINAVQKLQLQHRVHLITGLLGHHQMERLHRQINEMDAVMLYAEMGAAIPYKLMPSPNVFCNSFGMLHASFLAAQRMAAQGFSQVAVSTSFYDAGYGFASALDRGFTHTDTSFAGHFITPHIPRDNESQMMQQFVDQTQPDAVYAQYSGIFAREHATFLQQNAINKHLPMYLSHFAVDDQLLSEFPQLFHQSRCISSWMLQEEAQANRIFVDSYWQEYDRNPSAFALLGYENGLAIAQMLSTTPKYSSSALKQALLAVTFDGPRGKFDFHPTSHQTTFDHNEWLIEWDQDGYKKSKTTRLTVDPEQTLEWMQTPKQEGLGWYNAYLCH
jgi:branched-chain amino acid transport system substrate-binding protein